MSKEVQIIGWCDGEHATRTHSDVERVVALDGGRPVALDLCSEHDQLFEQLFVLMENGSPVAVDPTERRGPGRPPKARGGQHPMVESTCEFPGCDKGPGGKAFVAQSRTGLGAHMTRSHSVSLGEFERATPAEGSAATG